MDLKDQRIKILEAQLGKTVELISRLQQPQAGQQQLAKELVGSFNHKARVYYARQKYVRKITGHYHSTNNLKQNFNSRNELLAAIAISDAQNKKTKYRISGPKTIVIEILFFMYRMVFFLLKNSFKALRKIKKAVR